ncbi:hypothetical protein N0V87_010713 [Didymella glomerata]|uniref:Uncharacterized protein n=1 Tax=Didymella glomerata TaxID=749621 RepID=A0A9W8WPC4_9PLEO|nr:hypothetical protein N0V87_010713 [Didymella glomerata]
MDETGIMLSMLGAVKVLVGKNDTRDYNPDRVLSSMPKPNLEPSLLNADRRTIQTNPPDEVLQTPVTPVSHEGLTSLRNLIMKQDADALEEGKKAKLLKHVNLFAKAAQLSFTKTALQQNHIQLLLKVNDEAKVRRSTKSLILRTGMVMGFEELQKKRAKRADDDAAAAAKAAKASKTTEITEANAKRGRKRKKATADTKVIELRKKVACVRKTSGPAMSTSAHVNIATVTEIEPASLPWKAPVARMY